ncbi:IPT/TIG domain-containing protein [Lutibacter sp.]
MKKTALILILLTLLFSSCNEDDSIDFEVTGIATDVAFVGDIITVNGRNFDTSASYVVKFEDKEGTVTEITTTTIKVRVPERAITGEVTVNYNGKVISAGTITIKNIFQGDITLSTQQEVEDFGLNNYTEISGDLVIEGLGIASSEVVSLEALHLLTRVEGSIYIYDNNALQTLAGLNNITEVVGIIQVSRNEELLHLNDFENLVSLGGFQISNCFKVTNLNFLENINTLTGSLTIIGSDALVDYSGLRNITEIGGDLNLQHNNFSNIGMFSNLTSVGGMINLYSNNALNNLDGFGNLTYVGNKVWITFNATLTSYCGFNTLVIGNGYNNTFHITDNAYNPTLQDIIDGNCSQY